MSTNHRPSGPSRDELLAYAKTITLPPGFTPEKAVNLPATRDVLTQAYLNSRQEQESAKLAQEDEAAAAFLEANLLGITPEMKREQSIKDWVTDLHRWETDQLPTHRVGADGTNLCATSAIVPCCDGNSQIGSYAIVQNGDEEEPYYYGICQKMLLTYKAAMKGLGYSPRLIYRNITDTKQILEERKQSKPIMDYIYSFAREHVKDLPIDRKDAEGNYLCGLPESVPCCDHKTQHAEHYSLYNGLIYGICDGAKKAYIKCLKDTNVSFMRTTDDPKKLEGFSAAQTKKIEEWKAAQAKDMPLHNWVDRLVSSETVQTGEEPDIFHISEDDHTLRCGLPESVGCCDHSKPATGFPSLNGVVYGICGKAAWAYCEGRKRHNDPDCLKFTKDFEQARYFAQKWRERNLGYDSNVDFNSKSPLGNKTTPEDSARREANLAARKARDAEFRKDTRGSGQGSGKKNGRNGGKK